MESIKTEIVVVGAGPGGYAAAFYAADLGKKVILVEREKRLGGVCLNRGCIPSKALLYAAHTITSARESERRGITFGPPAIEVGKLRAWKESILNRLSGGVAQLAKLRGVQVLHGRGYFEDSRTLRIETEAADALPVGRYSVVGHEIRHFPSGVSFANVGIASIRCCGFPPVSGPQLTDRVATPSVAQVTS